MVLFLFFTCLFTREGLAWDRETHLALLQAALRISPAAAARIPAGYREVVEREVESPDLTDKECRYHPLAAGDRDAAKDAEKASERLLSGKGLEKSYTRAQAIGRYLHFVSDAVMPLDYAHESGLATGEFFANKNFLIFREKAAFSRPLAPSLRARAQVAHWDKSDSLNCATYRLAANAIVDALLLLPPEAGEAALPDEGPAIFVVDRLDTGLAGNRSSDGSYHTSVTDNRGNAVNIYYDDTAKSRSGDATKGRASFMLSEKPGLHVVEWVEKTLGGGVARVRALLFNNDDKCDAKIALKVPKAWEVGTTLPGTLAPRSVAVYEFDAPAGMPMSAILRTWTPVDCNPSAAQGVSTRRRVIVGNSGKPPVVDERVPETRLR